MVRQLGGLFPWLVGRVAGGVGRKRERETFDGVGRLVLAEPGEVFVLQPGHVRVVVGVVFLASPLHLVLSLRYMT